LCWHALGHIGYRVKWFGDVARMLRHIASDSRGDIAIAARYPSFARSIGLAIEVVASLYETAPESDASSRGTAWQSDVARILDGLERPVEIAGTRNIRRLTAEWSNVRFLMRLSPDRRSKAYQLLRTASDPRDVTSLGLGKRWLIVYALAGPALAAWRFVRRSS
jgi:hypothetical protein